MPGHGGPVSPQSAFISRLARRVLTVGSTLAFTGLLISALGSTTSATFSAITPPVLPSGAASATAWSRPALSSAASSASAEAAPMPAVAPLQAGQGSVITVSGGGFRPGSSVAVSLRAGRPSTSREPTASATGLVAAALRVPASARTGWASVELAGTSAGGQDLVEEAAVDVVLPAATTAPALASPGPGHRASPGPALRQHEGLASGPARPAPPCYGPPDQRQRKLPAREQREVRPADQACSESPLR